MTAKTDTPLYTFCLNNFTPAQTTFEALHRRITNECAAGLERDTVSNMLTARIIGFIESSKDYLVQLNEETYDAHAASVAIAQYYESIVVTVFNFFPVADPSLIDDGNRDAVYRALEELARMFNMPKITAGDIAVYFAAEREAKVQTRLLVEGFVNFQDTRDTLLKNRPVPTAEFVKRVTVPGYNLKGEIKGVALLFDRAALWNAPLLDPTAMRAGYAFQINSLEVRLGKGAFDTKTALGFFDTLATVSELHARVQTHLDGFEAEFVLSAQTHLLKVGDERALRDAMIDQFNGNARAPDELKFSQDAFKAAVAQKASLFETYYGKLRLGGGDKELAEMVHCLARKCVEADHLRELVTLTYRGDGVTISGKTAELVVTYLTGYLRLSVERDFFQASFRSLMDTVTKLVKDLEADFLSAHALHLGHFDMFSVYVGLLDRLVASLGERTDQGAALKEELARVAKQQGMTIDGGSQADDYGKALVEVTQLKTALAGLTAQYKGELEAAAKLLKQETAGFNQRLQNNAGLVAELERRLKEAHERTAGLEKSLRIGNKKLAEATEKARTLTVDKSIVESQVQGAVEAQKRYKGLCATSDKELKALRKDLDTANAQLAESEKRAAEHERQLKSVYGDVVRVKKELEVIELTAKDTPEVLLLGTADAVKAALDRGLEYKRLYVIEAAGAAVNAAEVAKLRRANLALGKSFSAKSVARDSLALENQMIKATLKTTSDELLALKETYGTEGVKHAETMRNREIQTTQQIERLKRACAVAVAKAADEKRAAEEALNTQSLNNELLAGQLANLQGSVAARAAPAASSAEVAAELGELKQYKAVNEALVVQLKHTVKEKTLAATAAVAELAKERKNYAGAQAAVDALKGELGDARLRLVHAEGARQTGEDAYGLKYQRAEMQFNRDLEDTKIALQRAQDKETELVETLSALAEEHRALMDRSAEDQTVGDDAARDAESYKALLDAATQKLGDMATRLADAEDADEATRALLLQWQERADELAEALGHERETMARLEQQALDCEDVTRHLEQALRSVDELREALHAKQDEVNALHAENEAGADRVKELTVELRKRPAESAPAALIPKRGSARIAGKRKSAADADGGAYAVACKAPRQRGNIYPDHFVSLRDENRVLRAEIDALHVVTMKISMDVVAVNARIMAGGLEACEDWIHTVNTYVSELDEKLDLVVTMSKSIYNNLVRNMTGLCDAATLKGCVWDEDVGVVARVTKFLNEDLPEAIRAHLDVPRDQDPWRFVAGAAERAARVPLVSVDLMDGYRETLGEAPEAGLGDMDYAPEELGGTARASPGVTSPEPFAGDMSPGVTSPETFAGDLQWEHFSADLPAQGDAESESGDGERDPRLLHEYMFVKALRKQQPRDSGLSMTPEELYAELARLSVVAQDETLVEPQSLVVLLQTDHARGNYQFVSLVTHETYAFSRTGEQPLGLVVPTFRAYFFALVFHIYACNPGRFHASVFAHEQEWFACFTQTFLHCFVP